MRLLRPWLAAAWLAIVGRAAPTEQSPTGANPQTATGQADEPFTHFPSWKNGQSLTEVQRVWPRWERPPGWPDFLWSRMHEGVRLVVPIGGIYKLWSHPIQDERDLLLVVEAQNPSGRESRLTVVVRDDGGREILSSSKMVNETSRPMQLAFPVPRGDSRGPRIIELIVEKLQLYGHWPRAETQTNKLTFTDMRLGDSCYERPCGANGQCRQTANGAFSCVCAADYYGDRCQHQAWGFWSWALMVILPVAAVIALAAFFRQRLRDAFAAVCRRY